MGIRFFSKKSVDGKTRTVEAPGKLKQNLDVARRDPANEAYFIPTPLHESIRPENIKPIVTLDDAVEHMLNVRPDVLSSDFEDDFLGNERRSTTKQTSLTIVEPRKSIVTLVFVRIYCFWVRFFSHISI